MCVLKTRRKYGLIHLAEALTSVHLMDLWYHRMNLTMIFQDFFPKFLQDLLKSVLVVLARGLILK